VVTAAYGSPEERLGDREALGWYGLEFGDAVGDGDVDDVVPT
jgi:hypothetical protein